MKPIHLILCVELGSLLQWVFGFESPTFLYKIELSNFICNNCINNSYRIFVLNLNFEIVNIERVLSEYHFQFKLN